MQSSIWPLVSFEPIEHVEANKILRRFGHKMGALHRGNQGASELICDESIKDFGKGPTFALRQDQLRPIEQRTLF